MANIKSEIGFHGENLACKYLISNGYKVIERNFRKPWGEIDIISRDADGVVVFVEVKTMRNRPDLKPEDNLTAQKLKKIQRTASMYVGYNEDKIIEAVGWRIDLLAVCLAANEVDIRHYKNI